VRSLIKLTANVTSWLPAGTALLTAKRYKVFPIRVKYCSIKNSTISSLFFSCSCRELGCDICVQLYQWTHCIWCLYVIFAHFSSSMILLPFNFFLNPFKLQVHLNNIWKFSNCPKENTTRLYWKEESHLGAQAFSLFILRIIRNHKYTLQAKCRVSRWYM
jgi:hypothetical protein